MYPKALVQLQCGLRPEREEFEARYVPYPALQGVERIVATQCRRTLKG